MAKAVPAPLSASLLAVPKGAATPAADPLLQEQAGRVADGVAALPQSEPVRRPSPEIAPLLVEEPRTALTVRLPASTQERLREAAHRTRREKQAIVHEALNIWLDERGF